MEQLTLQWQINNHQFDVRIDSEREIVIGRHHDSEICLEDLHVSRRHAGVTCWKGILCLTVFSRKNSVTINDRTVRHMGWVAALFPGDTFQIGDVHFFVSHARHDDPSAEPIGSSFGTCSICGNEFEGTDSACSQCRLVRSSEETATLAAIRDNIAIAEKAVEQRAQVINEEPRILEWEILTE